MPQKDMNPDTGDSNEQSTNTSAASFLREIESYTATKKDWIPDWRDAKSYKVDPDTTDSSQWAWEFLRRNKKFQRECDKPSIRPELDEQGPPTWQRRWGLETAKSYSTEYRRPSGVGPAGKIPSPAWAITRPIRIIDTTIGPGRHKNTSRICEIELRLGYVAAIFDLNAGLIDERLLDSQLASLKSAMMGTIKRLASNGLKQEIETKSFRRASLLTYLRVADAMSDTSRPTRKDIGEVLFEDEILLKGKDPETLGPAHYSRAISPHIEAANHLIYESGYLRLLVSD